MLGIFILQNQEVAYIMHVVQESHAREEFAAFLQETQDVDAIHASSLARNSTVSFVDEVRVV